MNSLKVLGRSLGVALALSCPTALADGLLAAQEGLALGLSNPCSFAYRAVNCPINKVCSNNGSIPVCAEPLTCGEKQKLCPGSTMKCCESTDVCGVRPEGVAVCVAGRGSCAKFDYLCYGGNSPHDAEGTPPATKCCGVGYSCQVYDTLRGGSSLALKCGRQDKRGTTASLAGVNFNLQFDDGIKLGLFPVYYEKPRGFLVSLPPAATRDFNAAIAWVVKSDPAAAEGSRLVLINSDHNTSFVVRDGASGYKTTPSDQTVSTGYPPFLANRMLKKPAHYVIVHGLPKELDKNVQTTIILLWEVELDILNGKVIVTPLRIDFEGTKITDDPPFYLGIEDDGSLVPMR